MAGEPPIDVFPQSRDEWPDGLPQVLIRDRGCQLLITFGDLSGQGPPLEIRIEPGDSPLESRVLRRFVPDGDLYVNSARTALHWWDGADAKKKLVAQVRSMQQLGRPGRGHKDGFYAGIAEQYKALVEEGHPHPVKVLGENNNVTISAASRWLKECRRRGYLPEKHAETVKSAP